MAILIQQETESHLALTTAKGKKIEVSFRPYGHVSVYILRNGMSGLAGGKHFRSMAEAIAAYKLSDIKTALQALAA